MSINLYWLWQPLISVPFILQGSDQTFWWSISKKSYKIWIRGARHTKFSQNMSNIMKLKVKKLRRPKFFFQSNLVRGVNLHPLNRVRLSLTFYWLNCLFLFNTLPLVFSFSRKPFLSILHLSLFKGSYVIIAVRPPVSLGVSSSVSLSLNISETIH